MDTFFPTANASIGTWGYDIAGDTLIPATHKDLMSYCSPAWISDYSFAKALYFRLGQASAEGAASERSLLLWGGLDQSGRPVIEPAFVVDAPPRLPSRGGAYELSGRTAAGEELFSLSFDMREVSDGGTPSFVFALPARADWAARLATITLSGPEGAVSLDGRQGPSMVILRDARTGRVRSMLRGHGSEVAADAGPRLTEPGIAVLFSAGLPAVEEWRK